MSDKKKSKQKNIDEDKTTKEEYAVAKYLRFGLPVREGKMHGMEVKCFIANTAVDKLLESKWSSSKNKTDPIFSNRASCVSYMNVLLEKGLFHRADRDKTRKEKDSARKKKKEKEVEKEETAKEDELRQRKSKKKSKKEKEEKSSTDKNKEDSENKDDKKKEEKEKKKKEKRLKLLMSDHQRFEDGDEVYVWIYDPVKVKTFLIGLLMLVGAIGLCMFPLWPEEVRIGVYYLSLAAAGFVGFILFLAVVRLILFCCVWALTLGKHHFWFLPNLTEDVGFFDSFRPLYKHDVPGEEEEPETGKKKKKKKTESKEEKSAPKDKSDKSSDKDDSDEFEVIKQEDLEENKEEEEQVEEEETNENSVDEEEEEESDDIDENSSEKEDKKTK